jgi:hypothetical protein
MPAIPRSSCGRQIDLVREGQPWRMEGHNSFEEDWHAYSYAGLIVDLRTEDTEVYDCTYGSSSTMIFLMSPATVAMLRIGPDRAIQALATRRDTAGSSISSIYS